LEGFRIKKTLPIQRAKPVLRRRGALSIVALSAGCDDVAITTGTSRPRNDVFNDVVVTVEFTQTVEALVALTEQDPISVLCDTEEVLRFDVRD
jgi:hypothetical protein